MTRRLMLGLVAAMTMALISFPAVATAESGFEADEYPAFVEGDPGATAQYFSLGGYTYTCGGSLLQAELYAPVETLLTEVGSSTCGLFSYKGPMEMNGCRYELHPETETFDIGPPGCGPIKLAIKACEASIPAQTGLAASYSNTGSGAESTVIVKAEASGVKYTQGWDVLCGESTGSNGVYTAQWELGAINEVGEQNGLRVEDFAVGVELAGEESEVPAEQPQVEAEAYPVRLLGEQVKSSEWTFDKAGLTCKSIEMWANLTQDTSSFASDFSGEDCTAVYGSKAGVNMNSCSYEYHVANSGPPYEGSMDVDCVNPGDAVEISTFPCTIKIPAQEGLNGIDLGNAGEGTNAKVTMDLAIEDAEYTIEKNNFLCPYAAGSFTDGEFFGELTWRGLK